MAQAPFRNSVSQVSLTITATPNIYLKSRQIWPFC